MLSPTTQPDHVDRLARQYVNRARRSGEALAIRGGLWARLARARGASEAFIAAVLADASARWETAAEKALADAVGEAPRRRGRPAGAKTLDVNVRGAAWMTRETGEDWQAAARQDLESIYGPTWADEFEKPAAPAAPAAAPVAVDGGTAAADSLEAPAPVVDLRATIVSSPNGAGVSTRPTSAPRRPADGRTLPFACSSRPLPTAVRPPSRGSGLRTRDRAARGGGRWTAQSRAGPGREVLAFAF